MYSKRNVTTPKFEYPPRNFILGPRKLSVKLSFGCIFDIYIYTSRLRCINNMWGSKVYCKHQLRMDARTSVTFRGRYMCINYSSGANYSCTCETINQRSCEFTVPNSMHGGCVFCVKYKLRVTFCNFNRTS